VATIGTRQLDRAVFEFFEGLRTYDAAKAAAVLADDADFESPWSNGLLKGKAKVQEFLAGWLKDPVSRPSFTIVDIAGDGAVTRLRLSVSGRFGKAPERVTMHLLCLQHKVHHVKVVPEGRAGHH
jgi:ketosteroid isomerase-like protein